MTQTLYYHTSNEPAFEQAPPFLDPTRVLSHCRILPTDVRIKTLSLFIENPEKSFTISEVSIFVQQAGLITSISTISKTVTLFCYSHILSMTIDKYLKKSTKGRPRRYYSLDKSVINYPLTMNYTTELKEQLALIRQATEQLSLEEAQKTIEKFEAEVNTVIALLEAVKIPLKDSSASLL